MPHDGQTCGGTNRCAACKAEIRRIHARFPIQVEREFQPHPRSVPWALAEAAYPTYEASGGRGQSLERLAERGGFGWTEFTVFLARGQIYQFDAETWAAYRKAAAEAVERADSASLTSAETAAKTVSSK